MAATLILILQIYAVVGAVFGIVFLTFGIGRVETQARQSYLFRPLLFPGMVLLWPILLWRWWQLETGNVRPANRHRPPRSLQDFCALTLALLIPLIVCSALFLRPDSSAEHPAVKLEDPQ